MWSCWFHPSSYRKGLQGKVYQVPVGLDIYLGEILAGANPISSWDVVMGSTRAESPFFFIIFALG